MELRPFGIDVVVEPGAIRTEWSGIAADGLRRVSAARRLLPDRAYDALVGRAMGSLGG